MIDNFFWLVIHPLLVGHLAHMRNFVSNNSFFHVARLYHYFVLVQYLKFDGISWQTTRRDNIPMLTYFNIS